MNETERLAAIEEIKRLRAKFARSMDTKQWKDMQDTIADDCVFDARDGSVVTELWIGGEDIVANIRRNLETAVSVHHAHMPEIEITSPTTAKGIWAMQDLLCFQGGEYRRDVIGAMRAVRLVAVIEQRQINVPDLFISLADDGSPR